MCSQAWIQKVSFNRMYNSILILLGLFILGKFYLFIFESVYLFVLPFHLLASLSFSNHAVYHFAFYSASLILNTNKRLHIYVHATL